MRLLQKCVWVGCLWLMVGRGYVAALSYAWPTDSSQYTVFLIGDAGQPQPDGQDSNLRGLQQQLLAAGKNSAVIFLGDNIYPKGLPHRESPDRPQAQARLQSQLAILQNYAGQVFVIPGNHDWERGGEKGWQYLQNQETWVEEYLQRGNTFLPDGGCPGPVEIVLNPAITLVVLDTQWWLHRWEKPTTACNAPDEATIIAQLKDILHRNRHKKVIVAAHHPMYTYGQHSGVSTWKQHLFPLTDLNKNLWIPLPGLGSLYVLYRRLWGDIQDTAHPRNRHMRETLLSTLTNYPGLMYVDGHDHSLQYIVRDSLHFIVSGAGSKTTPVRKGTYAHFTDGKKGFARLDFRSGGQVFLSFWEPQTADSTQPVYQTSW